jgi:hypothetical protein
MIYALPNLSRLNIATSSGLNVSTEQDWKKHIRNKWILARGDMPVCKPWKHWKSRDKYNALHAVALTADNDNLSNGHYKSAYEQIDIDDMDNNTWSVEHVLPRSRMHGTDKVCAESDPVGFVEATRDANQRRSNHYLFLWEELPDQLAIPNNFVNLMGDFHYVPPIEQRARLARKWLCIRATYQDLDPPSTAQRLNAHNIVALAKNWPVQPSELKVNEHYRNVLNWANPLLEEQNNRWYDDAAWRALVFGTI